MRISNWPFCFSQISFEHRTIEFEPLLPKIIRYRTYNQSDEVKFKTVLQNHLNDQNSKDLSVGVF